MSDYSPSKPITTLLRMTAALLVLLTIGLLYS